MERPRMFLDSKTTSSTTYETLLDAEISKDCKGLSYFCLSIDPNVNALYRLVVAKLFDKADIELRAIWSVEFAHLTTGVYIGFDAGDKILVQHRSPTGVAVKSGISLEFQEVIA